MKRERIKTSVEEDKIIPAVATVDVEPKPKKKSDGVIVHVNIPNLAIRKGPGTDFDKTWDVIGNIDIGIKKVLPGTGAEKGWGMISEGMWIDLDFTDYEA